MKVIYVQACLIGLLLVACGCEIDPQQKVLLADLHEKAKGEESRGFNFAFRMEQNLETGICDITITLTNTGDKPAPFPVPYPHPASHDAPFYFSLRSKKFDTRKTLAIYEILHEEAILLPGCSLRIEGLTLSAFGYTNQVFFSYGKSMDMEMEIFYNPSPMSRGCGEVHVRKFFTLEFPADRPLPLIFSNPHDIGYKILDKNGEVIRKKIMLTGSPAMCR